MGGYGSGSYYRWKGKKATAEESWAFGVSTLTRIGWTQLGAYYPFQRLQWTNGRGDVVASIGLDIDMRNTDCPEIILRYSVGRHDSARSIEYSVFLMTSKLASGGVRWWFQCPLKGCGRRVGKLYLPPGASYYGCRHCHNLTYQSCRDSHKFDSLISSLAASTGVPIETVRSFMKGDEEMWGNYRGAKQARARRKRKRRQPPA
jgi:hypothetical protein